MASSNIWDVAVNEGLKVLNSAQHCRYSSVIFIGHEKSEKSTLINQFMDRGHDELKRCVALEYTYARRTNKQMGKDVCGLWELGNGTANLELIRTIVKTSDVSICLVVDLTQPQRIWDLLETVWSYVRGNSATRITTGLVGVKCETLDELDTERKSTVLDALHYWAGQFQCKLVLCSQRDSSSAKLAKDLISSLAFGTKFNSQQTIDAEADRSGLRSLESSAVKDKLLRHFPAPVNNDDRRRPPGTDPNFADEAIDTVWRQKEEELQADMATVTRKRDKTIK